MQGLTDVLFSIGCQRCGAGGYDRTLVQMLDKSSDFVVCRAEFSAPLDKAVTFVDGEKADANCV